MLRHSPNRYSSLSLARHAWSDAPWARAWRSAKPKPSYDVVIIGGGGHGLATAYYLAANHGITNVAVLERTCIGSGNVGRNTTIVRSNYMLDGNTQFFEYSMKLWEGLSQELNFNVMFSQRGQIFLAHGQIQLDVLARKGNIMRLNGIDAELLDRGEVQRLLPYLDYSAEARCPVCGERDFTEFRYGGDARKKRPSHGTADRAVWHDYVFLFDNLKGSHREFWQHESGCRQWLVLERNTATNDVGASALARDAVAK